MAKNADVRLRNEHGHHMTFLEFSRADRMLKLGKAIEKKRQSGRLLEIQLLPDPGSIAPSSSEISPGSLTVTEIRVNAIAAADLRLNSRRLDPFEIGVMEKVASFRPASFQDRIVLAQI